MAYPTSAALPVTSWGAGEDILLIHGSFAFGDHPTMTGCSSAHWPISTTS
jgi:hypothetical protein